MKKLKLLIILFSCVTSWADNGMDVVPDHEQLIQTLKSCDMLQTDFKTSEVVSDNIISDICRKNKNNCSSELSCLNGYKQFRNDRIDYKNQIFYKCKLDFSELKQDILTKIDFSNSVFYKVQIILPKSVSKDTFQLSQTNHLCSCQVGIHTKSNNVAINLNKKSGTMCTYFKNEKELNQLVNNLFSYIGGIPKFSGLIEEVSKKCFSKK